MNGLYRSNRLPTIQAQPLARELDALYTSTDEELRCARTLARKAQPRFGPLLLLKAFQRLGYFPPVVEIPTTAVQHARMAAGIGADVSPVYDESRTLYRHLGGWGWWPMAKTACG